jgi:hypothetical protein
MRLFAWRIALMQQSHKIFHGFLLIFKVNKGCVLPVSFCQDPEEDSLELGPCALESEKYSNT